MEENQTKAGAPDLEMLEGALGEVKKKRKKAGIAILVIVIVIAALYGGGVYLFQNKFFMPHTLVNGVDVSMQSEAAAGDAITKDVEGYVLTIQERNDQTEQIAGADIGLTASLGSKVADAIHSQNALLWFVESWQDKQITLTDVADYDADALDGQIKKLSCMDKKQMAKSRNATISKKMTDGSFTIVDEVYGTVVKPKRLKAALHEAVGALAPSVDLSEKECYVEPKVKADSEEARKALEKVNQLAGMTITYQMTGTDPYLIDGDQIRKWIRVSKNLKNVSLDEDKVLAFVDAFADKYDTAFTERSFVNHAGETVTVPGGYYGWQLDRDLEKQQLLAEVKARKDVTREPNWKSTAASLGDHEYGDKYIEVDLSRQTVYLMEDGKIAWECPCVTGKTSRGHGTTPGMYNVYSMQRNRTLNGRNDDGSEYHSPVSYWMPFNGGQGLHDARWRGSFGGTIYVYSGSHGCVNLPTSRAGELYELIEVGTPVIVYWSN